MVSPHANVRGNCCLLAVILENLPSLTSDSIAEIGVDCCWVLDRDERIACDWERMFFPIRVSSNFTNIYFGINVSSDWLSVGAGINPFDIKQFTNGFDKVGHKVTSAVTDDSTWGSISAKYLLEQYRRDLRGFLGSEWECFTMFGIAVNY